MPKSSKHIRKTPDKMQGFKPYRTSKPMKTILKPVKTILKLITKRLAGFCSGRFELLYGGFAKLFKRFGKFCSLGVVAAFASVGFWLWLVWRRLGIHLVGLESIQLVLTCLDSFVSVSIWFQGCSFLVLRLFWLFFSAFRLCRVWGRFSRFLKFNRSYCSLHIMDTACFMYTEQARGRKYTIVAESIQY